jgi:hypothetical protein
LFVYGSSSLKSIQIVKVNNRIPLVKGGIIKTSLWQSSNQRHLTALEPQANASARARLLPFITLAAGFAMTGAFTAAQAFYTMSRSRSRP